jgi:FeS assembly SUF system protein
MEENQNNEKIDQPESQPAQVLTGGTKLDALVIEAQVIEALQTCYDPEIPVNIYELGLIYEVNVAQTGDVDIKMTLTAPNCPAAQSLPAEVERKVRAVPGVNDATVEIVWEPAWDMDKMSEVAKFKLGML